MYTWCVVRDADPRAYELMKRHYSFHAYRDGRRQDPANYSRRRFVGPGERMVLLTPQCDALFVWRRFIDKSGQTGINCAVFRNESTITSSDLIREADAIADLCWPSQRHYTYVRAAAVKSRNPGWCFICAGWHRVGTTKGGLIILARCPSWR